MKKSDSPRFTLAMPTYNEEGNIQAVLEESIGHLERMGEPWEIIVIDNASTDRTREKVLALVAREPRLRLVSHESNRLYSGSCQTALQEVRGDILAIMDSDGQFTIKDLPKFIRELEGGASLVFGWRRVRHDPLARKVISMVFNLMGKLMLKFPFHDLNCGIRVMDRRSIQSISVRHPINMANPEFFVRARLAKLKMSEVPIEHAARQHGQTSHNLFRLWGIFLAVYRYFRTLSQELNTKGSL